MSRLDKLAEQCGLGSTYRNGYEIELARLRNAVLAEAAEACKLAAGNGTHSVTWEDACAKCVRDIEQLQTKEGG